MKKTTKYYSSKDGTIKSAPPLSVSYQEGNSKSTEKQKPQPWKVSSVVQAVINKA